MDLEEIKNEREEITVIKLGDYLFENEEALNNYLDSCEAELKTFNFSYDREDFQKYMGPDFWAVFEWDPDSDEDDERIDAAFTEYQEKIDDLCDKYDITFDFKKYQVQGPLYILEGTYGNLKKFAAEYSGHLEEDDTGDALYYTYREADIDIDSGDDSFCF